MKEIIKTKYTSSEKMSTILKNLKNLLKIRAKTGFIRKVRNFLTVLKI